MVGPHAESKYDAANGLVTDAMDPRHGRDDPGWNGEWAYQTRFDAQNQHWLALITIPFTTLGVPTPSSGTFWRGNFGRVHVAGPDRIERSIWSATPSTQSMDDRGAFGDIVFDGVIAPAK